MVPREGGEDMIRLVRDLSSNQVIIYKNIEKLCHYQELIKFLDHDQMQVL